ncbi:Asp-tRNA(Asn)/Glu-tRNA(Gln) amidotransferase subunit GatA [Neisseriaceae bacterium PsAf]|nr:Asp-tRNA(Asn)/Glu-tRNA(Gln) amidotransferase subunit GatA [Neisseriaceae bacterium PsAf]
MKNKTIKELSELLTNKEISAQELAQYFLKEIEKNDQYNAIIYTDAEKTLAQAKKADELISSGQKSVLTGIPIAYKDLFCHLGWRTTCASKMLNNFVAPYTATVVERLDDIGMVPIGRANMDEFAMGSTTESSYWKPTLNPWNTERVPGGSSGGSAAAVAARLTPVSLGSDTGGSIRQPSAYCGVTGIKPTYGLVSRFGMVAYASSFDQAGPIGKTAEDCALLLNQMVALDEKDSTSVAHEKEDYTENLNQPVKGMKIATPKEFFQEGLDKEVASSVLEVVELLKSLGAEIVEISLPKTKFTIPVYYVLASAEASSNLQRYDGVRYGYRAENYDNLEEMYTKTRAEGFGSEVKRRIMIGTYVLSHGYYDDYYVKAQKIRRLIAEDLQEIFKTCDAILSPVTPSIAPKIGELMNDPVKMYLSDIYTLSLNLAGLPGMSLPAPHTKDNMPVGVQLIGNYFAEGKILNIAHQIQENSDWHLKSPVK